MVPLTTELRLELIWYGLQAAPAVKIQDGRELLLLPEWGSAQWQPYDAGATAAAAREALLRVPRANPQEWAAFVRAYGPLFVPAGREIEVSDLRAEQARLWEAGNAWAMPEDHAYLTPEELAARNEELAQTFSAYGPDGKKIPPGRKRKPRGRRVKVPAWNSPEMKQRAVAAPFSTNAAARLRFEIEKQPNVPPRLIARPTDLAGLIWLSVAARVTRGDVAGRCRNARCDKPVLRQLADGDSMRRLWHDGPGAAKCAKHVQRHPEDDRYRQQLRGLRGAKLAAATRRIAEEELNA